MQQVDGEVSQEAARDVWPTAREPEARDTAIPFDLYSLVLYGVRYLDFQTATFSISMLMKRRSTSLKSDPQNGEESKTSFMAIAASARLTDELIQQTAGT